MNWNVLNKVDQLDQIKDESKSQTIAIFKHSTRCATSMLTLNRLERSWNMEEMSHVKPYLLDLIRFRELSNLIASTFEVLHQSPQVLLIRDGRCIYHESHFSIDYSEIKNITEDISQELR